MAYDDKQFGTLFPTRTGGATGTANERKMLDALGGSEGFRTRIQTNSDGTTTMLRTKNGMPQFTTTKVDTEVCELFMDSGLVDFGSIGYASPELLGRDGVTHYGTKEQVALERLGDYTATGVGMTQDGAVTRAFKATVDSAGLRTNEASLAAKKLCAVRAPASIFTGKLRLYFQAQYGAKLAAWRFRANVANAPPSLDRDATANGETITFQFHSVHTGIYTDTDKQHWLVQLGVKGAFSTPNTVNIFRMKAGTCAEAQRKKLKDLTISSVNRERIEAYILSQSFPEWDFCISIPCSIPINQGLGYGWHFNWSGGKADIVGVETINTGGETYKHKSTHYRINITRSETHADDSTNTALGNEGLRWSAALETVQVAEWKNSKWQQVIATPEWSDHTLSVFGTLWGDRFGDGAPIYVFYTRDKLNVVRFSLNGGDSVAIYEVKSSPSYFGGNRYSEGVPIGAPCSLSTCGLEGGTSELSTRNSRMLSSSFTCEDAGVSATSDSYTYTRITQSEKSITGTYSYGGGSIGGGESVNLPAGCPTVTTSTYGCVASSTPNYTLLVGPASYSLGVYYLSFSRQSVSGTHGEGFKTLCVIPLGDAEAVYLWGDKTTLDDDSGTTTQTNGLYSSYGGWTAVQGASTITYGAIYDGWAGGSSTPVSNNTSQTTLLSAHFVSNAGTLPFTPEFSLSEFFAGEAGGGVVHQSWWTRTSAGKDPSTDGNGVDLTGGYLPHDGNIFIGWS